MTGIKRCRKSAGLTQAELAARIGVAQSSVAMWETGRTQPRASMLVELGKILQTSVDRLLETEHDESDGDRPSGLLEEECMHCSQTENVIAQLRKKAIDAELVPPRTILEETTMVNAAMQRDEEMEAGGCKWCKEGRPVIEIGDEENAVIAYINGGYLQVFDMEMPGRCGNVKINYCPGCGMQL